MDTYDDIKIQKEKANEKLKDLGYKQAIIEHWTEHIGAQGFNIY